MATEQPQDTSQNASLVARTLRSALLQKQPEIEEVDEEDTSPGSDQSDTTITAEPTKACEESPEVQSLGDLVSNKQNHMSPKIKQLTRSEAIWEDCASPPLDHLKGTARTCSTDSSSSGIGTKSVTSDSQCESSFHGRLEKDGSQSSEAGTSSGLSRDSSMDSPYKDSTGIDLEDFIKKTLNKTPKDRSMLIKLEVDLVKFIREPKHHYLNFPPMSSYDRMLVHRIAAFFGLDHNVDQTGKCVIVNKTQNTRIPDFIFRDHVANGDDSKPKMLLRRGGGGSFDELTARSLQKPTLDSTRSARSLEERQQMYQEARSRIFTGDEQGEDQPIGYPENDSNITAIVQNMEKLENLSSEDNLWNSLDSSGYDQMDWSSKAVHMLVPKANSFGGTGTFVLQPLKSPMRGNSLSKADSMSMGIAAIHPNYSSLGRPVMVSSPPSNHSGNFSLPKRCLAPVSSPHQANTGSSITSKGLKFVWVASDFNSIPPGSVMINPQTGQPFFNADGTQYRYIPGQPLPTATSHCITSPQKQPLYHVQPEWTSQPSQDGQSSQELTQQLATMRLTPQPSMESTVSGDSKMVSASQQHVNQTVANTQPQSVYFQGSQIMPVPQQPVQYTCTMNCGMPDQVGHMTQGYFTPTHTIPVEGNNQGQQYPNSQYCQQYVQPSCHGNYVYSVTSQGQPLLCHGQNCDMNYLCAYNVTSPVGNQTSNISGFNYPVSVVQQQTAAKPNKSHIYFTVPNPQSYPVIVPGQQGYTFSNQQGMAYQASSPPSQHTTVTSNVQLNSIAAQPINMVSNMNSVSATSQQQSHGTVVQGYGGIIGSLQGAPYVPSSYQSTSQTLPPNQQFCHVTPSFSAPIHTIAPHVVPYHGVNAHSSQMTAAQTFHTMYRPSMQMPMQLQNPQASHQPMVITPSTGKSPNNALTQHNHVTVSAKGLSEVHPGLRKVENGSGESADAGKDKHVFMSQVTTNHGEKRMQCHQNPCRPQGQTAQFQHAQSSTSKSPTAPKPQLIKKQRNRDIAASQQSTDSGNASSLALSNMLEIYDWKGNFSDVEVLLQQILTDNGGSLQKVSGKPDLQQCNFNTNNQTISSSSITRVFAVFPDSNKVAHILKTHSCSLYKLKAVSNMSALKV